MFNKEVVSVKITTNNAENQYQLAHFTGTDGMYTYLRNGVELVIIKMPLDEATIWKDAIAIIINYRHENIAELFPNEFVTIGGVDLPIVITRSYNGINLLQVLRVMKDGINRFSIHQLRAICFQLSRAVHALFVLNILHQDICLENFVHAIAENGNSTFKLSNFFKAVLLHRNNNNVLATPDSYMAPELFQNPLMLHFASAVWQWASFFTNYYFLKNHGDGLLS
jgi:hypothetical protein